jgi:hypothetical protein
MGLQKICTEQKSVLLLKYPESFQKHCSESLGEGGVKCF